jgi:hypothetical protein
MHLQVGGDVLLQLTTISEVLQADATSQAEIVACLAGVEPINLPLASVTYQDLLLARGDSIPDDVEITTLELIRTRDWAFPACPSHDVRAQSLTTLLASATQQMADLSADLPWFSDNFGV